jgi:hypothetical protein
MGRGGGVPGGVALGREVGRGGGVTPGVTVGVGVGVPPKQTFTFVVVPLVILKLPEALPTVDLDTV